MCVDQWSKVLCSLLLLHSQLRTIEIYRNSATDHLLLPHIKQFSITKRGLELVSLSRFLHGAWFWRNRSLVIFYYLTRFGFLVIFTSWDIGQYVYCNCFLNRLWHHNHPVFFYMTKVSRQKFNYVGNEKSFQGEIKFFIISKWLSLKEMKQVRL